MKNQAKLKNVVDSLKGRFVSLLVKQGEQRKVFSAKVNSVTPRHVMFSDMNGRNRRVNRAMFFVRLVLTNLSRGQLVNRKLGNE